MSSTALAMPSPDAAMDLSTSIEQHKITDQASLDMMVAHAHAAKDWLVKWDTHHNDIINKINEALDMAKSKKFNETRQKAAAALDFANKACTAYLGEEERKREERARLDRVKAEQEGAEKRDRELKRLEAAGATKQELKAVERAPIPIAPPARTVAVEKPKGLVIKTNWSFEYDVDEADFVVAILKAFGVKPAQLKATGYLLKFLEPNEKSLGAEARSAMQQFSVPGAHAASEKSSHTRRS